MQKSKREIVEVILSEVLQKFLIDQPEEISPFIDILRKKVRDSMPFDDSKFPIVEIP